MASSPSKDSVPEPEPEVTLQSSEPVDDVTVEVLLKSWGLESAVKSFIGK